MIVNNPEFYAQHLPNDIRGLFEGHSLFFERPNTLISADKKIRIELQATKTNAVISVLIKEKVMKGFHFSFHKKTVREYRFIDRSTDYSQTTDLEKIQKTCFNLMKTALH